MYILSARASESIPPHLIFSEIHFTLCFISFICISVRLIILFGISFKESIQIPILYSFTYSAIALFPHTITGKLAAKYIDILKGAFIFK